MKALTISQPYASLIASGAKWVENRRWWTDYRGQLAIHAGKGQQYLSGPELQAYPTGCVVAVAKLVGCVRLDNVRRMAKAKPKVRMPGTERYWSEILRHKHTEGPWCWILEDITPLPEPVQAKGQVGLWEWRGRGESVHPLSDALFKGER